MALVSANQFQLTPDVGRAIETGSAIGTQFQQGRERRTAQQQLTQSNQFAQQALTGDKAALGKLGATDADRALQIQTILANESEADRAEDIRESESLTKTALIALQLPLPQLRPFIERQRDQAKAEGRTTERFDNALLGTDEQLREAVKIQSVEGQKVADVVKRFFPAQTTLSKNLIAAGLEPGTPEFQEAALKGATRAPSITVTTGGAKKEQEKLGELRVKQLGNFQEQAETAIEANQSLDVLENIDVNTGALEPAKQGLAAFGRAFGIDTSSLANVSAGEAFNAEAKRIVLSVKASQKGPQTDKDEATIRDTVANLGNTQEGNQFIIDSAKALNNRKIERSDFFTDFLDANETLKGANKAWSRFKRNTPMVSVNARTPEGLPVFFFKFEQGMRNLHPNATREEIIESWRQHDKKRAK